MPNIFYLKLTQAGYLLKPHLDKHFVLSLKDNFFVFSSQKVNGLKSILISTQNINGQPRPQYIIENAHTFNPKFHIFEYTLKGSQYLAEHQEKLKPMLEVLQQITQ